MIQSDQKQHSSREVRPSIVIYIWAQHLPGRALGLRELRPHDQLAPLIAKGPDCRLRVKGWTPRAPTRILRPREVRVPLVL